LPIKLLVEPPELAFVPWETLFDKRGKFHICCYGTTSFARTAKMEEEDLYIYDKAPIKVLGMISAPKSFYGTPHELDTDAEQKALTEALKPFADQVQLRWTPAGTYRELRRQMVKGCDGERWDVFLFIGHGLERQIVLEEDGGNGFEFVNLVQLKGLLTQPLGPKLVILNSCRGAQVQDGDRFASTAESLVQGGSIAAVVAMQFDISDVMGTAFSPAFFETLTLEVPIQQAMVLTRLELQRRGFSEWISPVLYMQNKDGLVMRPGSTRS
jgi:CHAT domain